MANKKMAGVAYFKIDGEGYSLSGDIEVPLYTETRESVVDITGTVIGYKSTYIPPYAKGTFYIPKDFPLDRLFKQEDMTVTIEFETRKVYTLSGAWLVGETPYNATDGTAPLQFDGESARWN